MTKFIVKENSYGHKKRIQFIINQIDKYIKENDINKDALEILDVGCGSGLLITLPLGQLGYNILGIDTDKISIDFANTNNIFEKVKFENIPIENIIKKYDIILACEILEHLERPIEFLRNLKSRLKDDGIIILTTPNGHGWSERESRLVNFIIKLPILKYVLKAIKKNAGNITLKENDRHIQTFSFQSIKILFDKSNFIIQEWQNGPLFGGPIIERTMAKIPGFKTLSNMLGNIVSSKYVLVWYFVLKNK